MKELHGHAAASADAPAERCLELLRAVDEYPAWYPEVVREVAVLERGDEGTPSVVRATLRVSVARFAQELHVLMRVTSEESRVTLTRVGHEPADEEQFLVDWEVSGSSGPGAAHSEIAVSLSARLDVPRLLPLGGLGDSLAAGFVSAAAQAVASG